VSDRQGALVIRRIRASEGRLLRELRLRSLQDAPEAFGQTVVEASTTRLIDWYRKAWQSCRGDQRAWMLAQHGDEVVGLVSGRHRLPTTLLLFSMWVAPDARRSGVGRQLIDGLEGWARRWGATETVLWVLRGNLAALGFYERLGFEALSHGRDAQAGERFGALTMRRAIDPTSSSDASGACLCAKTGTPGGLALSRQPSAGPSSTESQPASRATCRTAV